MLTSVGDVLEWITWGGGGLGDPLTRSPSIVAKEVHRRLVSFAGAANNYGVVVNPDYSVDEVATEVLRKSMAEQRKRNERKVIEEKRKLKGGHGGDIRQRNDDVGYDRGGTMSDLVARCREETGLQPPRPQWERDPYGPHTGLPYVKEWYKKMRKEGLGVWDRV
jgi:5-oxoprolinase (ATP-hydrolysing)